MNLNQITVPSLNIERSVAFYTLLGLKQIVQSPHYARFESPEGHATFSVELVPELPKGHGVSVYFETEHLDAEYRRLTAAGVQFDHAPQDQPWLWREARLRDPDGNAIVLFHAGENRKFPPWRISS